MAIIIQLIGEHQYELMDNVAAKFHEEPGVFKLMVCTNEKHNKMHIPTVFTTYSYSSYITYRFIILSALL